MTAPPTPTPSISKPSILTWTNWAERQQRILILRFYRNLTQEQIGDRLRISQMHVSRLLERALAYLRTQITKPA
jgi:RNA polymerase sigma factor (sigma-70 family)